MSTRRSLNPGWSWPDTFSIPAGVRVGDTVYVSGMLALTPDGDLPEPGDMYAQSRRAFANIGAVLAAEGGALADVVRITAFLTDLSLYDGYKRARSEAFPGGVPASTAVATPALLGAGAVVEIEAVAVLGRL